MYLPTLARRDVFAFPKRSYAMPKRGAMSFQFGKFGTAGKLLKEFGTIHQMDCRSENEIYVGELTNWRVQKLSLR